MDTGNRPLASNVGCYLISIFVECVYSDIYKYIHILYTYIYIHINMSLFSVASLLWYARELLGICTETVLPEEIKHGVGPDWHLCIIC